MAAFKLFAVDLVDGNGRSWWTSQMQSFQNRLQQLFATIFGPTGLPGPSGPFTTLNLIICNDSQFTPAAVGPLDVVIYLINDQSRSITERYALNNNVRNFTQPVDELGSTWPGVGPGTPFSAQWPPSCSEVFVLRSFPSRHAANAMMLGNVIAETALHEIMHNKCRVDIHLLENNTGGISRGSVSLNNGSVLRPSEIARLRADLVLPRPQFTGGCALNQQGMAAAATDRNAVNSDLRF